MAIVATKLRVFGALLLLAASTTAQANEVCGTRSPLLESMGDQYFYLDARPMEDSPTPDITPEFLLDAMQAHSLESGVGRRTTCIGTGNNLVAKKLAVEIEEVEFRISGAGVLLSAREVDLDGRNSRLERIAMLTDKRHILTFANGEFTGITRIQRPTRVGSFMEEVRLVFSPTDSGGTLSRKLYINGDLAEWMDWVLIR